MTADIDDHVKRLVATCPPLSDAQIAELRVLLRPTPEQEQAKRKLVESRLSGTITADQRQLLGQLRDRAGRSVTPEVLARLAGDVYEPWARDLWHWATEGERPRAPHVMEEDKEVWIAHAAAYETHLWAQRVRRFSILSDDDIASLSKEFASDLTAELEGLLRR